ncbi:hypothetical protein Tco_1118418 [Tanacetum coccineum]
MELLWLVLRMISEAELQVLADLKSNLYGLRSEKFGIELFVELKYFEDCCFKTSMDPCIMTPRMTTQSACRATSAPRGGRAGGRTGRGGGRTRGRFGNQGNGRIDGQGGQVGGQGNEVNDGVDGFPDFSTIIAQQLQNLLPTILAQYDKKGGAIVYTRWIDKMESVQDMSGCEENQKVKSTVGSFVGKALTWWNSHIHIRSREAAIRMSWEDFKNLIREEFCPVNEMQKLETKLVPHLVTPKNKRIERYIYGLASQIRGMVAATEPITIQRVVQKAGTLTDKAVRMGQ